MFTEKGDIFLHNYKRPYGLTLIIDRPERILLKRKRLLIDFQISIVDFSCLNFPL